MPKTTTKRSSKATLSDDESLEQMLRRQAERQHKAVELRAYQLFLERGSVHGHDLRDWLDAEHELYGSR
jgi:hypothetical protein